MKKFSSTSKLLPDDLEKNNKRAPLIMRFDLSQKTKTKSFYKIQEYDEYSLKNDQENFKIEKVECLIRDDRKFIIYLLVNLLSFFIISLIFKWFPKMKLILLFQNSSMKKATHVCIYSADKKLHIVEAIEIVLPKIQNSPIILYCESNVHSFKTKIFTYKSFKYIYSPYKKSFLPIKFEIATSYDLIKRKFMCGLTNSEKEHQKKIYGDCDLEIKIASLPRLLLDEIKDSFYLFQFFSIILWSFNDYLGCAIMILIGSFISLGISVYEVRKNLIRIQKKANYVCDVVIYRRINSNPNTNYQTKQTKQINSKSVDLVPGDLFELPEDDLAMPCDALLLNGTVMMNESVLTGESTPVIKSHIPNSGDVFNIKTDSKYILYAGTKIIQKRNIKNSKVMALVLNTGFNTEKGNLIRSLLYQNKSNFKFENDSWKYILFMGAVSIFGFLISLKYMIREGMSVLRIINVGLDLLTLSIHPALPICLGIGISFAIRRLKKYGISCINRKRINLAGQVNLVCFDKTGTLTEDHLDIYGFRPINYNNGNFVFDSFKSDSSKLVEDCYRFQKANKKDILSASSGKDINFSNISREEKIKLLTVFYVECLATCHSIFRANGRLMGDPLDIEMFKSTGWVFIESFEEKDNYDPLVLSNVRHPLEKDTKELLEKLDAFNSENYDIEENILKSQYELSIIRRFEFNSNLQRMTVIVKDVNEQNFKIYCKGSPEKILELCREDTLPHNFSQILANYTEKGFRVIALCCKLIKMDYFQSQKIGRDIAENNMIFLGFIVVQNKLKENTTTTIEKLHEAGLKLIMATGDNMLTAVSVSKECKMIPSLSNVFQCEIIPFNNNEYYLNCKNLFKENSNAGNEDMSERDSKNHGISSNNNSLNNNDDQIEFNRDSKLTNNLNVNSIDQFVVDEYDSEDYDDEYNITRKKKKKIEVENDIDSLRIHLDNFNFSQEEFEKKENDFIMAVTGRTFELLYKLKNKYLVTGKLEYKNYHDIFKILLHKTKIYARMSPHQKKLLIESLRDEEFIIAMCGDGANDIAALRSADVGISLSLEELSIAAHFTSSVPDIKCLLKLFREGKASLITSIQCFKFVMLYSIIQFLSANMLLMMGTYLSDSQFFMVDLIFIFPLSILFARTGAYKRLTHHKPTGALISFPIILSVILQSIIQLTAQLLCYLLLINQIWYLPFNKASRGQLLVSNQENTTVFLISFVQYIIMACAFTISKPFKKEIYSNYLLCIFLAVSFLISFYLIIFEDTILSRMLWLSDLKSLIFRFNLILIAIANFILSIFVEKYIVPKLTQRYYEYYKKPQEEVKKFNRLQDIDKIKININ